MTEPEKPSEEETIACEVCFKHVPISEAKSEEGSDYVLYYCGLECYAKWQEQEKPKKD